MKSLSVRSLKTRTLRFGCAGVIAINLLGAMPYDAYAQVSSTSVAATDAAQVLLKPEATPFDKAKACELLARIGGLDAVPALAGLLSDAELSNYARQALEHIADPSTAVALRSALGSAKGELQIGIVASLGRKRDTDSIPQFIELLKVEDNLLAAASANALGRIGNLAAATAITDALNATDDEARAVVLAQAALKCGQQLIEDDQRDAGLALFTLIQSLHRLPSYIRGGALVAHVVVLGSAGHEILLDALSTDDDVLFESLATALGVVSKEFTRDQIDSLLNASGNLAAERRVLIVQAIADMAAEDLTRLHIGQESLPAPIGEWSRSDEPELRAACLALLARSSSARDQQFLLEATSDDSPVVAGAARRAIEAAIDDRYDQAILGMLTKSELSKQIVGIDLAERRRLSAATPLLLELAKAQDTVLRTAALTALGSTIKGSELPQLLELATAGPSSADKAAAREGLRIALVRLPQSDSAAALARLWQDGRGEVRVFALERLADVGGGTALLTLEQAVLSRDVEMQDAGSRVLGEWMTPDAAPLLLKLAETLQDPKLKLRSLRGALRIARQLDMPIEERVAICRRALALSSRDDERKLVADIYRQYASAETLEASLAMLNLPSMHEAAITAADAIAPRAAAQDAMRTRTILNASIASEKSAETKQRLGDLLRSIEPAAAPSAAVK